MPDETVAQFGCGTLPIGLDATMFVPTDHKVDEDVSPDDIDDADGYFLQGTVRKLKQAINLQFWCKVNDWRANTPEPGSTCSGYFVMARGMARNNKGHMVVTLQARRHKDKPAVDTNKYTS